VRVIIDGRFVLDEADLHRRLAGALGYGPLYRPGFEALSERLRAGDPRPLLLTWTHGSAIRMALGAAAYADLVAMLEAVAAAEAGKNWADRFVFRLFD
jgi:H+/gluconate symporter-like permease